jgi:hypothetical protein
MPVLTDPDRARLTAGLQRFADFGAAPNVLKADLAAAVAATDTWIDANAAAFNAALPAAFRTNATQTQKTMLFCLVALARVSIALLKHIVGEVD